MMAFVCKATGHQNINSTCIPVGTISRFGEPTLSIVERNVLGFCTAAAKG